MKPLPGPSVQAAARKRPTLAVTFRALSHRNYQLWFFGQGLSLIGTWMQTMAQQVLVYRMTGSATALGIVSFMGVIPLVPFALWGGSLSDRFPKRRLLILTQSLMMTQALVLGVLIQAGDVRIWQIYLMAFLLGAFKAVDMPARQSYVVEMVEGREDLTSAIGLNSAIHNAARTLGPALAGVVIAMLGEAPAFFLNALSFLAVIISLLLMRDGARGFHRAAPDPCRRAYERGAALCVRPANDSGADEPGGSQLLPLAAIPDLDACFCERDPEGERCSADRCALRRGPRLSCAAERRKPCPLGLLLSAVGVGAITGALLVASLPEKAPRGRMLTLGNLAFPAFLLLFAGSRSLLLSFVVMLFVGMSHVFQNAMANTLLQLNAPDELRGRVMSLYSLVSGGMTHLGGLQAGFATDWLERAAFHWAGGSGFAGLRFVCGCALPAGPQTCLK